MEHLLFNRRFLGIEKETEFLELSKHRREEIENPLAKHEYKKRIEKFSNQHLKNCHSELVPESVNEGSRNEFGMTLSVHEDDPFCS